MIEVATGKAMTWAIVDEVAVIVHGAGRRRKTSGKRGCAGIGNAARRSKVS